MLGDIYDLNEEEEIKAMHWCQSHANKFTKVLDLTNLLGQIYPILKIPAILGPLHTGGKIHYCMLFPQALWEDLPPKPVWEYHHHQSLFECLPQQA